ncbi:Asp23/Gls24 family envelope stress response protein [Kineococcus sp. NPDC059986]|uniref:Asp23/Gls24 family envelope stress response protein n=1 Tax=Kineococcus sp. NPDC059986 TaxID=3155538 RepID=UPI00344B9828
MSESVVATIAGLAACAVPGVVDEGEGAPSAVATVGRTHATVDLTLVAETGADLAELMADVRRSIADSVQRMTDLRVTEVTVTVVDVRRPGTATHHLR